MEYDIENDSVVILKGIPDDICVAQPKYSPDGKYVIGVAYNTEYRKLGLIYCANRDSTVFKLDFEGNFCKYIYFFYNSMIIEYKNDYTCFRKFMYKFLIC